jgi:hypothetical protein
MTLFPFTTSHAGQPSHVQRHIEELNLELKREILHIYILVTCFCHGMYDLFEKSIKTQDERQDAREGNGICFMPCFIVLSLQQGAALEVYEQMI